MKLNEIRDNENARKKSKRVGRGMASGKGKTSGSGQKGQKSRTGVAINGFEGGQMPIYRRLPKRGFTNIFKKQYAELTLARLQKAIDAGKLDISKEIDEELLKKAGVIGKAKDGVRLLATGQLTSKVNIKVAGVTAAAKTAVEELGGAVIISVFEPKKIEKKAR